MQYGPATVQMNILQNLITSLSIGANSGGKYDGLWQQWYNNGQMKKNVNFVDGKKNGKEVTWKKDGTIKSEVIYKDGKIIKRL